VAIAVGNRKKYSWNCPGTPELSRGEREENMTRINFYSLKLVKENAGLYNVPQLNCPENVYQATETILNLSEEPQEKFCILCMNTKNRIAGVHTISVGSLNSTIVHPREVFKAALLNNSSAIILLHNHPSGDPEPSAEDIAITNRLMKAGEILGIQVLDHIIIGDGKYISLKERRII
jgi:DNA repair protein RadC